MILPCRNNIARVSEGENPVSSVLEVRDWSGRVAQPVAAAGQQLLARGPGVEARLHPHPCRVQGSHPGQVSRNNNLIHAECSVVWKTWKCQGIDQTLGKCQRSVMEKYFSRKTHAFIVVSRLRLTLYCLFKNFA